MAARTKIAESLTWLLDASRRPIYAVSARRQIVYCNAALSDWLGLQVARIVGREVEYHSEPSPSDADSPETLGPLAALCPPPAALSGKPTSGTVSCIARDGRLVHRRAEFVPLSEEAGGVLVILGATDMSPHDVAAEIAGEPSADDLHLAIRRFRHTQAGRHGLPSLVGHHSAVQKVRDQVAAAAASGANVLIVGPAGSGRGHAARTIHYRATTHVEAALVPLDCRVLTDDLLRRTLASLAPSRTGARQLATLIVENLESLTPPHQSQLLEAIRQNAMAARVIATLTHRSDQPVPAVSPALYEAISTITIRMPSLVERLEDLPLLCQYFVEACNQGRAKQIGSVRPEAIDQLALYSWPGELHELRTIISTAHRNANTHEITLADLPELIHHAASAANRLRHSPERIVLGELLSKIEKEIIERALAQANGNKTVAATLLGMTRPRLYRRLVQLGLAGELPTETEELPEFIERDPSAEAES
jgi:transcriptional regulator with PAS, ATPase and Fis domain